MKHSRSSGTHDASALCRRSFGTLTLLTLLSWTGAAMAVGTPSTYRDCATRSVTVATGGTVKVDLSTCHSFGLGVVATAPAHGTATAGDSDPVDTYLYTHDGSADAAGDRFVVLDDNSDFITVNVTIQGSEGGASITGLPVTLPSMAAGIAFSQRLTSTGGQAPYAYRLASGALPAGLVLGSDGLLSGKPTQRGPFSFSVRVQDSAGASATRSYSDVVKAASLSIAPGSAVAVQGSPFSQALAVSGGLPPHRFQLEPGAGLPPGIALSSAGLLSGTPTGSPNRFPVRLRVTDSSTGTGAHFEIEAFTLDVVANPEGLPMVSIAVSPAAVAEDETTRLVFTITRDRSLPTATVVTLATSGSAKTEGVATLVIPAGATTASLRVRTHPDQTVEPDETVVLSVAPGTGYVVGSPSSASAVIVNDDLP